MSSPSTVTEKGTWRWPAGVVPRAIAPPQRLTSTALGGLGGAQDRVDRHVAQQLEAPRRGAADRGRLAVGHRAERVLERLVEEQRRERAPGVVGAAGVDAAQRDRVGRDHDGDVQRLRHGVLAEARQQVRREPAVEVGDAAEDLAHRVQLELERGRHAEVPARAAQRPEQAAAAVLARGQQSRRRRSRHRRG